MLYDVIRIIVLQLSVFFAVAFPMLLFFLCLWLYPIGRWYAHGIPWMIHRISRGDPKEIQGKSTYTASVQSHQTRVCRAVQDPKFLDNLKNYDKDALAMNSKLTAKMHKYIKREDFVPETVKKASGHHVWTKRQRDAWARLTLPKQHRRLAYGGTTSGPPQSTPGPNVSDAATVTVCLWLVLTTALIRLNPM